MMLLVSVALCTSCGPDEPDDPNNSDPTEKPDPTPDDDDSKYQIVGFWKTESVTPSRTLEFDRNGYLLEYSGNNTQPDPTTGSWEYESKTKEWTVKSPSWLAATYRIVGGKLFDTRRNYVYTKVSGISPAPDTQTKLAGTKWSGSIEGGRVELSFGTNGILTETVSDDEGYSDSETATYEEDGNTFTVGYSYTLIYQTFPNPISFEIYSSNKKLKIYSGGITWILNKK